MLQCYCEKKTVLITLNFYYTDPYSVTDCRGNESIHHFPT